MRQNWDLQNHSPSTKNNEFFYQKGLSAKIAPLRSANLETEEKTPGLPGSFGGWIKKAREDIENWKSFQAKGQWDKGLRRRRVLKGV